MSNDRVDFRIHAEWDVSVGDFDIVYNDYVRIKNDMIREHFGSAVKWRKEIAEKIRKIAPRREPRLIHTIQSPPATFLSQGEESSVTAMVTTNSPQAWYTEFGTGIRNTFPGAAKREIYPRNSRFFRVSKASLDRPRSTQNKPAANRKNISFEPGGSYPYFGKLPSTTPGPYVYLKKHKGQAPNPFFFHVLEEKYEEIMLETYQLLYKYGFG